MDDSNITMEEYIRLEEEKARKCGKVFNWETAKYGKIWYDEDIHDLRSVETEFPAIAFNDEVSSEKPLSYEPTVSSLNDEIDFRISFDDSDDEDYTVIFDKNSFSYKIISTNDLKTDLEKDNEKVNMPSIPSPEPIVSCFDDLDFFNDFENEFLSIVYNDAQTSKSDLLTELILSLQHIDEFDDETSFFKYNEEEKNVFYFNDLFPFNIIHTNDLKSEKDNDDNEVDIIQSSEGNEITQGSIMLSETSHDKITKTFRTRSFVMNLKDVAEAKVEGYTEEIVHDFEQRLETIFNRHVNRVHILDFKGLTPDMRQDLVERIRMVYKGNNVIGASMNVPIFVGTFFVVTDFVVLENMDAYRDEGMGDVIFGEPFLREVRIKTRRFEWMITIYNGDDEVNEEDKMNGISHPFQKLKGFYKGVLNLGPDYIQDAKMEKWLTRGHISMHEME
ncbi:hypothetical protein Tco_1517444 [Tanacetum coccineum]